MQIFYNNSFVLEKLMISANKSYLIVPRYQLISKDATPQDIAHSLADSLNHSPVSYVVNALDTHIGYILSRRYSKAEYLAQLEIANIQVDELEPSSLE